MYIADALGVFERTLRGRPLATDSFKHGAYATRKAEAIMCAEIAPDPDGWIRALRVDVDHADAATRWMDAELPQPTFIVQNPANGRAHLVWELGFWVRTDHVKEMRLFEAVRRAFTEALAGDRAYSGRFQHNPLASCWRTIVGPQCYSLRELLVYVDIFAATSPARRSSGRLAALEQDGRNCSAFARASRRAYACIDAFRCVGDRTGFAERVTALVAGENAAFTIPLPASEVRSIARSIAGWTWNVYHRGNGAARARRAASERTRAEYLAGAATARDEARKLRAEGLGATEIARRLKRSRRWVYTAWAAEPNQSIDEAMAAAPPSVQSPHPIRVYAGGRAPAREYRQPHERARFDPRRVEHRGKRHAETGRLVPIRAPTKSTGEMPKRAWRAPPLRTAA